MKPWYRSRTVLGANLLMLAASPQVAESATRLFTTIIAMIASTGTSIDRPAITIETVQDAAIVGGAFIGWIKAIAGRARADQSLRLW